MGCKNMLKICLLIAILHIATTSAKKSSDPAKNRKNGNSDHDLGNEDAQVGLSSELQQLRELASKESGSIILEPSHGQRKKNKHHNRRRRPHGRGRPNKKNRTRPLDILKAEDDPKSGVEVKDSEIMGDIGHHHGKSQKEVRTRARGSRHLDLESKTGTHQHHHHRRPRTHHHHKNGLHNHRNTQSLVVDHKGDEQILHKKSNS